MANKLAIILGGNSTIAKAIAVELNQQHFDLIIVSRSKPENFNLVNGNVDILQLSHYHEDKIRVSVNEILEIIKRRISSVIYVFSCHGLLHNEKVNPEKRIEDFCVESAKGIFHANTITPMLWLKHLVPNLPNTILCKCVFFSARVGSIADNRLGGWYSYRCSKAALNMLVQTASIELARRAKHVKLLLFHPGTVNSPLSKPFQSNVPKSRLFDGEFVAKQLIDLVDSLRFDGKVRFLDWEHKNIRW